MFKLFIKNIFSISHCDYDKAIYDENVYKVFTKKEFYKMFPDYKPYKVIKSSLIHNDHTYSYGLNVIKNYKPCGNCSHGGFYLSDISDIYYYDNYGENIAIVSLPDDTLIYLENSKIKVSKLFLNEIIDKKTFYSCCSYEQQLEFVKYNYGIIKYIDIQTD